MATPTAPQPSPLRRVDALIALTDRYLPALVDSDGSYSDWNVAAPAFVALSMSTLEAVFQLPPPRHRVSAEAVTRSLADYGITFAWLAAPTDETERADRMMRFDRDEWASRRQADKRYTTILPERSELYRDMIAQGKMPEALLGDAARLRIAEMRKLRGPKGCRRSSIEPYRPTSAGTEDARPFASNRSPTSTPHSIRRSAPPRTPPCQP